MEPWTIRKVAGVTTASVVLLFCLCQIVGTRDVAAAQAAQAKEVPTFPTSQPPSAAPPPQIDEFDRVAMLWYRQRLAKSGAARGEEIFFMSCWMCHNEYTIAADKNPAPSLKDLFKPENNVTDEAVIAKIRGGGPHMPAYPASVITDVDLKDLLSYLRTKCGTFPTGSKGGGGCYDENNPPPNPLYKGGE